MRALYFISAIAGCWTGHEQMPPPPNLAPPASPLRLELHVTPTRTTMAELANLSITFEVRNISSAALDPQLDNMDLLINGDPSMMFANTNGNGGREPEWYRLPPGGHIQRTYTIGQTLFDRAGQYTLQLRVSGVLSESVGVEVRP